jgi:integrase
MKRAEVTDIRAAKIKRSPPEPIRLTGTPNRLPVPDRGNRIYYDGGTDKPVPGFGVRVTAAGARSFVLRYWTKAGRQRTYTIGDCANWTVGAARIKARALKRLVEDGGDPMADIEAEREAPTVADLCDRFVEEYLPRNRPGTALNYTILLDRYIKPHFGLHTKVADVQFEDVERLHHKVSKAGHPYAANRTVAVLSRMFSLAIRWHMRSDNPCRGIEKNPEAKRKRYLSGDELKGLTTALAAYSDQGIANIFRLLLLTGARRGEVLGMKWADIDLGGGTWTKPASTTKQKADHTVPLSAPARQLLSEIRERQTAKRKVLGEFVFAGAGKSGHVVEIKKAWKSLCKTAGISGLRIHDVRHSFASQLASGGASLPLIGALLGHSNPATTARYSHLFQDPQKAAVEKVAAIITAASNGGSAEPPTLLPTRRGRRP